MIPIFADNIDKCLFSLIRLGLHISTDTEEYDDFLYSSQTQNPNWQRIYTTAVQQGVSAIAWDGLSFLIKNGLLSANCQPDRKLRLLWAYNVEQIEHKYRKQYLSTNDLATRLSSDKGIRMVVFKGLPLSSVYPTPEHREFGDTDCWLNGKFADGNTWAENQGMTVHYENPKHTVFKYNGITIENHDTFFNVTTHRIDELLENSLQELINDEKIRKENQSGLYTLPPTAHALFLLRHTSRHLSESIGIRHLTDWAMFVRKYGSEIAWNRITAILNTASLNTFWNIFNGLVVDTGLLEVSSLPPFERDPRLERRVLDQILHPSKFEISSRNLPKRIIMKIKRFHNRRWIYEEILHDDYRLRFWQSLVYHLKHPDTI